MKWAAAILILGACGRFHFDPLDEGGNALGDGGSATGDGSGMTSGDGAIVDATGLGGVTNDQMGPAVSSTTSPVQPTLPMPSTAGTMLIVVFATNATSVPVSPAPWQQASLTNPPAVGTVAIFYYPNNPGGIVSASFGNSGATQLHAQMSEWTGLTTRGTSGSNTGNGTQLQIFRAAATVDGEVAIAVTGFAQGAAQSAAFTHPSTWVESGNSEPLATTFHFSAAYRQFVDGSTVNTTVTSGQSGNWAGTISTFRP